MTDIIAITQQTFGYNFHSHTQFCDGRSTMEECVTAAVEQGFSHYGFSPHSVMPFPTSCNIAVEDVPLYLAEAQRLKEKFAGQISIYTSMEIDYIDEIGPSSSYYDSLALDYRIGSVHFLRGVDGEWVDVDGSPQRFLDKLKRYFNDDVEAVVRDYYAQVQMMIMQGGLDIVGHIDKIGYNASCHTPGIDEQPWYDALVKSVIEAAMDCHLIIEINTKSWGKAQRFFPSQRYFPLLKRWGAPIVYNSDAHEAALINHGRNEAREIFCRQ